MSSVTGLARFFDKFCNSFSAHVENFSPVTDIKKGADSSLWCSLPLKVCRNHPASVKQTYFFVLNLY